MKSIKIKNNKLSLDQLKSVSCRYIVHSTWGNCLPGENILSTTEFIQEYGNYLNLHYAIRKNTKKYVRRTKQE